MNVIRNQHSRPNINSQTFLNTESKFLCIQKSTGFMPLVKIKNMSIILLFEHASPLSSSIQFNLYSPLKDICIVCLLVFLEHIYASHFHLYKVVKLIAYAVFFFFNPKQFLYKICQIQSSLMMQVKQNFAFNLLDVKPL